MKTLEEFTKKVEELTGLKMRKVRDLGFPGARFELLSPTGIVVTYMHISESLKGDQWYFGGVSSAFPDNWQDLCNIGRK